MRMGVMAGSCGRGGGIATSLATLLGVAGLLTAMAPWGTDRLSLPLRAEYFLLCGLCWKAGLFAGRRLLARLRPADQRTGPRFLTLMVLAGSLPGSVGILLTIRLLLGWWVPLVPLYLQTLALGLGVAFAYRGLFSLPARATEPPAATRTGQPTPILCSTATSFLRLHAPALAHCRLLALQSEDHYLRIHTDGGSELVLLRLRDAIDLLGDAAGWQPHRSFWLAAGVRARSERRGQSWQLVLPTGLVVPVSRSALPLMRAAGFGAAQSEAVGTRARLETVSSTAE